MTGFIGQFATTGHGDNVAVGVGVVVCFTAAGLEGEDWQPVTATVNSNVKNIATAVPVLDRRCPFILLLPIRLIRLGCFTVELLLICDCVLTGAMHDTVSVIRRGVKRVEF